MTHEVPSKYSQLEVVLKNTSSGHKQSIFFKIEEHSLAQRWARMLAERLLRKATLEKNFLFHGWAKKRDLSFLCGELNLNIKNINNYFVFRLPGFKYKINDLFDPMTVDQSALNAIHRHFENLKGPSWNTSRFFIVATPKIKNSIRALNNLCHETENYLRSEELRKKGMCHSFLLAGFCPMVKVPLEDTDYDYFSMDSNFGDVKLHYAQIGKTHLEAYFDQDSAVGDEGISGLRYLSGEFDIFFSERVDSSQFIKPFYNWLVKNGFDPKDKKLALGYIYVARLDRKNFPGKTNFEILSELHHFDDVCKIALGPENPVECEYLEP